MNRACTFLNYSPFKYKITSEGETKFKIVSPLETNPSFVKCCNVISFRTSLSLNSQLGKQIIFKIFKLFCNVKTYFLVFARMLSAFAQYSVFGCVSSCIKCSEESFRIKVAALAHYCFLSIDLRLL